jgi:hypothetical protein
MGFSELFTTINNRWHVCVCVCVCVWGHDEVSIYRFGTSNEDRAVKSPCALFQEVDGLGKSLGASSGLSARALHKNFPEDLKMPHLKAAPVPRVPDQLR